MGKAKNINNCITSQFKNVGDQIFLLAAGKLGLTGATVSQLISCTNILPSLDLKKAKALYYQLNLAIVNGLINSAHDISDGGLLTAISESIIGSNMGANLNFHISAMDEFVSSSSLNLELALLAEGPANIIVSVDKDASKNFIEFMKGHHLLHLGEVTEERILAISLTDKKKIKKQYKWQLKELKNAWTTLLPFA